MTPSDLNSRALRACRLLFLGLFFTVTVVAQERSPDVRLDGVIIGSDNHTYKLLPFDVPAGVFRITVDFTYSGKNEHTTLDLGIEDTRGVRGWSGGSKAHFTISETDATPSYLPGEIVPGVWRLIIGVPNIRPNSRSEYHARIYFTRTAEQRLADSAFSGTRQGPGWFRGDLHVHTGNSDASCLSKSGKKVPCPVFKTLETATQRKLDFIAIADHNDVSHFEVLRELAPYYDNLLLLHGREITTFQGHANVYGTDAPIDFRVGTSAVPDMAAVWKQVRDAGGFISINHPNLPSGEACMGCGWKPAPDLDLHMVQAVEAVNGADAGTWYSGIKFWDAALNRGLRVTGVGGSDNHNADAAEDQPAAIDHPTTVVYADDLSEHEILAGIKAGHVFIDVQGSTDRMLELNAKSGSETARMGDNLQAKAGSKVEFSLRATRAKGEFIEIVRDGEKLDVIHSPALLSDDETRSFEFQSDGLRHWVRATVRNQSGNPLLISNPVYINFYSLPSPR